MVNEARRAIEGIYSALITPMDKNENLNRSALRALVDAELSDGVEGFYCCGSSGEGLLLTLEERKKVLEVTLDQAAGRVPVIAHVGTLRTADVIGLARHAKAAGAAAVSMIPPYYYKFSMPEIVDYYQAVLDAVPGLPVILYNIPQFTSVSFNKENAGALLENEWVAGIKHTSQDLYGLERMRAAYPDKVYFNGFDEMYLPALTIGATSAVGTTVNLFAPTFLGLREAFGRGDLAAAEDLQSLVNRRVETMVRAGIFSAVKYGWTLRGIDCGACRAPFAPLTEESKRLLDLLLREER